MRLAARHDILNVRFAGAGEVRAGVGSVKGGGYFSQRCKAGS